VKRYALLTLFALLIAGLAGTVVACGDDDGCKTPCVAPAGDAGAAG
jgi:hypothetical protein